MACSIKNIILPRVGPNPTSQEMAKLNTNLNFTRKVPAPGLVETREIKLGTGKFGTFGGKFVPEVLIAPLARLEAEFNFALHDHEFKTELATALNDYVGRETPLLYAENLSNYHKESNGKGPEIYLKREDLNHGGSSKMNNAIAQVLLAKRMGQKSIVTVTAVGHHGVAAAAACAKLKLDCTIFMGTRNMERYASKVQLMKLLGAQVKPVDGSFQDAVSESMKEWVNRLETSYYLSGTAVGPHPIPTMVREFQSVIGKETRKQAMEKWGGKPEVLIACVGSGGNAMGLFHEFVNDKSVRLIGVEGGGMGIDNGQHAATLARGEVGVYHGAMSYLLQDEEGQITRTHSIASGLEYPGVSPDLSFLKDAGRAEFYTVTDREALSAYKRLCRLEGIIPSLEASHALAFLERLSPTLSHGAKVVVNCSSNGDNDADIVMNIARGNGSLV